MFENVIAVINQFDYQLDFLTQWKDVSRTALILSLLMQNMLFQIAQLNQRFFKGMGMSIAYLRKLAVEWSNTRK
jgi:hypothetical protein